MTRRNICSLIFACVGMFVLILDARTAFTGATEGIDLCIRTVIPSLFPFIVLSMYLTGVFPSLSAKWLRPVGRSLHIPENATPILIVGLLGGYPVGAQCVRQAYDAGALSQDDAQRMLRFCNNAGPAFLFGIGGHLLGNTWLCFLLWFIHILSAMMVGWLTPGTPHSSNPEVSKSKMTFTEAVRRSAGVMASVCSWIILFRIVLTFLEKWLFWRLPEQTTIFLSGMMELTNGCAKLANLQTVKHQFVLFSIMLGFGGICVGLQTNAVLYGSGLSTQPYFLGKLAQGALSGFLSLLVVPWIPGESWDRFQFICLILSFLVVVIYYLSCRKEKLGIAFQRKMMYTDGKSPGGITYEAISQKG